MSSTTIVGTRKRVTAVFTDTLTGAKFDPDEVHLEWRKPDGAEVVRQYNAGGDPAITKTATGEYECRVLVDAAGIWTFRWYSDGDDLDEISKRAEIVVSDW